MWMVMQGALLAQKGSRLPQQAPPPPSGAQAVPFAALHAAWSRQSDRGPATRRDVISEPPKEERQSPSVVRPESSASDDGKCLELRYGFHTTSQLHCLHVLFLVLSRTNLSHIYMLLVE